MAKCEVCEGDGEVLKGASIYSTGPIEIVPCPDCDGTGEVPETSKEFQEFQTWLGRVKP